MPHTRVHRDTRWEGGRRLVHRLKKKCLGCSNGRVWVKTITTFCSHPPQKEKGREKKHAPLWNSRFREEKKLCERQQQQRHNKSRACCAFLFSCAKTERVLVVCWFQKIRFRLTQQPPLERKEEWNTSRPRRWTPSWNRLKIYRRIPRKESRYVF